MKEVEESTSEKQYRLYFRKTPQGGNCFITNFGRMGQYSFVPTHSEATVFYSQEWIEDIIQWINKKFPDAEILIEESFVKNYKIIKQQQQ